MGMVIFMDDEDKVCREFQALYWIFDILCEVYFFGQFYFKEIFMGMLGDYLFVQEEGSIMVCIGSLLFGL